MRYEYVTAGAVGATDEAEREAACQRQLSRARIPIKANRKGHQLNVVICSAL
jgi:hypothetical protein